MKSQNLIPNRSKYGYFIEENKRIDNKKVARYATSLFTKKMQTQ